MRTDIQRRKKALELRKSGWSIKAIAKRLPAAQSSVSIWTRDVTLSKKQINTLRSNTHSPEVIKKRRLSRLSNELRKRNAIIDAAKIDIQAITRRELWLIGVALYWAEGGKTQGMVRFSNGDPNMIKLILKFFRDICKVNEQKMRCHIHIHSSLNVPRAEKYWQEVTGINPDKFFKTYSKPNKSSKGTRNSLPYGVCDVYVLDSKLLLKIKGWTDGIYKAKIVSLL